MHADGGGVYLQVTVGKDDQINKSWIFRFALAGKERQMGPGSLGHEKFFDRWFGRA